MTGELEALALYAGQSAGLVDAIEPAAAIVRAMVDEADAILRRLVGASN
jgi:NAD(P)H-dependent flavin oxidoreductase YrpB (nitropropane dioxygenase family)